MSHLLKRDLVCDRLCISRRASFRLFPSTRTHLIDSNAVVSRLNESAVNTHSVDSIPYDVVTAQDLAWELGVDTHRVIAWTHREKPIPHWRINKQTTRFSRSTALEWARSKNGH